MGNETRCRTGQIANKEEDEAKGKAATREKKQKKNTKKRRKQNTRRSMNATHRDANGSKENQSRQTDAEYDLRGGMNIQRG